MITRGLLVLVFSFLSSIAFAEPEMPESITEHLDMEAVQVVLDRLGLSLDEVLSDPHVLAEIGIIGKNIAGCDCLDDLGDNPFEVIGSLMEAGQIEEIGMEVVLGRLLKKLEIPISGTGALRVMKLLESGEEQLDLSKITLITKIFVDDLVRRKSTITSEDIDSIRSKLKELTTALADLDYDVRYPDEIDPFLDSLDKIQISRIQKNKRHRTEVKFHFKDKKPFDILESGEAVSDGALSGAGNVKLSIAHKSTISFYEMDDQAFKRKKKQILKEEHKQRVLGLRIKKGKIGLIPVDGRIRRKKIERLEEKILTITGDDEKSVKKRKRMQERIDRMEIFEEEKQPMIDFATDFIDKAGRVDPERAAEVEAALAATRAFDEDPPILMVMKGIKVRVSTGIKVKGLRNIGLLPIKARVLAASNTMEGLAWELRAGNGFLTSISIKNIPENDFIDEEALEFLQ